MLVSEALSQQRCSQTSIYSSAKILNLIGVWGVGEEREMKIKRWKGKEVHGTGKQIIGVNGLGVRELQEISVSKT